MVSVQRSCYCHYSCFARPDHCSFIHSFIHSFTISAFSAARDHSGAKHVFAAQLMHQQIVRALQSNTAPLLMPLVSCVHAVRVCGQQNSACIVRLLIHVQVCWSVAFFTAHFMGYQLHQRSILIGSCAGVCTALTWETFLRNSLNA